MPFSSVASREIPHACLGMRNSKVNLTFPDTVTIRGFEMKRSSRFARSTVPALSILVGGIALGAGVAVAITGYGDRIFAIGTAAAQEEIVRPAGGSPFHDHIAQAAIPACQSLYPQMGAILTDGASYTVQSRWHANDSSHRAVEALVGMVFDTSEYSGPAMGYVMASPSGKACTGSLVRVMPVEADCAHMVETFVSSPAELSQLESLDVYTFESGEQLALIALGSSCVAVSTISLSEH